MSTTHDRDQRPTLTRRTLLAAGAAASLVDLVPQAASAEAPRPVADWLHRPGDPPFRIPSDYVGLHSDHGLGKAVPPPDYPYDAIRSHDTDDGDEWPATQWARIERQPGRYDWSAVDRWIAAHPGRTRIWVLFGCPPFYQRYPGEAWRYPYLPGGGSPPRDPAVAASFIRALLDRHPGQIRFVEIWNEPNLGPGRGIDGGRWLPSHGQPGYFTGTARDLASLARAVKRALQPGVQLMAGAWEGQTARGAGNSLVRFSLASDGAGGRGRDHVDVLSVHSYTYRNDPNNMISELRAYRERFTEAGYPRGLASYVTEIGAEAPAAWTNGTPSAADKIRTVKKWLLIPAALGFSGAYLYKHSALATLGDPARNPAIGKAIGEVRNAVRNKTLIEAAVLDDQSIWLSFADGTAVRA